jgi:hypothetical protein
MASHAIQPVMAAHAAIHDFSCPTLQTARFTRYQQKVVDARFRGHDGVG